MIPQVVEIHIGRVSPEGLEARLGPSPDIEEPIYSEELREKRERSGESLWRVLTERQINMIAFSGTIGNGLFLGSGATVAMAGPGGAVLAYAITGIIMSAVMSCLGEMTALMPVNAPMMEFPRRFIDRGVGFAVGWMYWFAYATGITSQLYAVTEIIRFIYKDKDNFLEWKVGHSVDPAVWFTIFLILIILVNMLPVKYFGELDYIFGCIKLTFITMLIVLMLILATKTPSPNAQYKHTLGTKYWDSPWSFFSNQYRVMDDKGNLQRIIKGLIGRFYGVWLGIIKAIFSYTSMDIFAATAAESKALGNAESMKMAARKITLRIVTVYCLAVLTASFVVPMDHPFLNGEAPSPSAGSIFVIAIIEAGYPKAAHVFNAVFLLSASTCAINLMYQASRVLYTLALQDQTGPEFITRRLRHCRNGVPIRAVLVTGLFCVFGYMGRSGPPAIILDQITHNCTVSLLIVYIVICTTYLCFYQILQNARKYGNFSEAQAASFDRDHPLYPYKSHGQWLKGTYGASACTVLLLLNGLKSFLQRPFGVRGFLDSYISIPVFFALIIAYKIHRHGFEVRKWGPERSCDLSGTIQASNEKRKGRLEFTDDGFTKENIVIFFRDFAATTLQIPVSDDPAPDVQVDSDDKSVGEIEDKEDEEGRWRGRGGKAKKPSISERGGKS